METKVPPLLLHPGYVSDWPLGSIHNIAQTRRSVCNATPGLILTITWCGTFLGPGNLFNIFRMQRQRPNQTRQLRALTKPRAIHRPAGFLAAGGGGSVHDDNDDNNHKKQQCRDSVGAMPRWSVWKHDPLWRKENMTPIPVENGDVEPPWKLWNFLCQPPCRANHQSATPSQGRRTITTTTSASSGQCGRTLLSFYHQ